MEKYFCNMLFRQKRQQQQETVYHTIFTCKTLGEVADPMALGLHSAEKSGTITITSDVMNMKYFFRASDGEFIDRSTYL